jgi:hypothetical protein
MRKEKICWLIALIALSAMHGAMAGILPEDRVDILYHSYDGEGVQVTGPSILVRKGIGNSFSVYGNYYVDTISSASVDVISTASPYEEERTEVSAGVDFLHGDTIMSLGFTQSDESDFIADSAYFNISQDVFGGLTTVNMGYATGSNEVSRNGDPTFTAESDRKNYRLGLTQVLTKNMLLGLSLETITDEGFLNNPYRSVRYLDTGSALGYSYEPEVYPNTRTSTAVAIRSRYFLKYRAAVFGEYRYFTDTWGIDAHTAELGYTHPTDSGWIYEGSVRYYSQTSAAFYSDLYPGPQWQNYLARDKELATFTSQSLSLGVSYQFSPQRWDFLERGSINLFVDYMLFNYDDFRDVTAGGVPGQEPLFSFNAQVWQLFVSFWF